MVKVTERKTALDWACFMEDVAAQYEHAEKITLVMDNFTHIMQDRFTRNLRQIRQMR